VLNFLGLFVLWGQNSKPLLLYRISIPRPRGNPLPRAPRVVPRVVYRPVAAPRPIPREDARDPVADLEAGFEVVLGGFSTNVVSVVLRAII
jgi:hypothetical protein